MVQPISLAALTAIAWIFSSTAFLLTCGRFYIRWQKHRKLAVEDLFNGAALVALIAYEIINQVLPLLYFSELEIHGLTSVIYTNAQNMYYLELNLASILTFWVTQYLVKGSFLALYWSVFKISPRFRKFWWPVAIFNILAFCAVFISAFWQCGYPSSPQVLFDPVTCSYSLLFGTEVLWVVLNFIGDILIVILPMSMLKALHIPKAKKFDLAAVFTILAVDSVIDIVRMVTYSTNFAAANPNVTPVISTIEPAIAVIICALASGSLLSRPHRKALVPYDNSEEAKLNRKQPSRAMEMDNLFGDSSYLSLYARTEITSAV